RDDIRAHVLTPRIVCNLFASDTAERGFIRRMAIGVTRAVEKCAEVLVNGGLWIVFLRPSAVHAARQDFLYLALRERGVEQGVRREVESGREILLQKFTGNQGVLLIGTRHKRSAQTIEGA